MSILHAPVIRRDSTPSLFQRFVLILRVYILENTVLILKKCPYFWLASLSCLTLFGFHEPSFVLFVLPSKLHCDITKATQSYLEHLDLFEIAEGLQIERSLAESRTRRRRRLFEYKAEDKGCEMSPEEKFRLNFFCQ